MLLSNATYKVRNSIRAQLQLRTLSLKIGVRESQMVAFTESNVKIRVDLRLIGQDKVSATCLVSSLTKEAKMIMESFQMDDLAQRLSTFVRKSLEENLSKTYFYEEVFDGYAVYEKTMNDKKFVASTSDKNFAKLLCKLFQGKVNSLDQGSELFQ